MNLWVRPAGRVGQGELMAKMQPVRASKKNFNPVIAALSETGEVANCRTATNTVALRLVRERAHVLDHALVLRDGLSR